MNYVAVFAADADVWFVPEEGLWEILSVPTPAGAANVKLDTRLGDEGYTSWVPREMWIEARGTSDAPLADVIVAYANAAAGFLPMIAFAANAYVGDLEPKLAYDATPGSARRAFFQGYVRQEHRTFPRPKRSIDVPSTAALLESVMHHQDADRLRRAIVQYALALGHWLFGHEILAVAHLYISAEALTKVALRAELAHEQIAEEELVARWGIDRKQLDTEVRKRLIFQGDDAVFNAARSASDGFEHGFLDFDRVRELSREVRDTVAGYVRTSIIDLAAVPEPQRSDLFASPRDVPMRSFVVRYVWGEIVGDTEPISPPGEEYPGLEWVNELQDVQRDGRKLTLTHRSALKPHIAAGLTFETHRVEGYGPAGISSTQLGTDIEVIRGNTGTIESA